MFEFKNELRCIPTIGSDVFAGSSVEPCLQCTRVAAVRRVSSRNKIGLLARYRVIPNQSVNDLFRIAARGWIKRF